MREIEVGVGTFFKPLATSYYLGSIVEDAGEEMIIKSSGSLHEQTQGFSQFLHFSYEICNFEIRYVCYASDAKMWVMLCFFYVIILTTVQSSSTRR